jgi:hypothetical protein
MHDRVPGDCFVISSLLPSDIARLAGDQAYQHAEAQENHSVTRDISIGTSAFDMLHNERILNQVEYLT